MLILSKSQAKNWLKRHPATSYSTCGGACCGVESTFLEENNRILCKTTEYSYNKATTRFKVVAIIVKAQRQG